MKIVTTSYRPSQQLIQQAEQIAYQIGGSAVQREKYAIDKLRSRYHATDIVVVSESEIKWYKQHHPVYFFHPSMALVRVERLMKGEPDSMLQHAGIRPGDRILDCTAGLGSDAIVFSYASGPDGQVTAIESEPDLAFLLKEGLKSYDSDIAELNEAMRRIQVIHHNHLTFLQACEDKSFDVVYFDPMFRKALEQSSSLNPIRAFSNPDPLQQEAIAEARRVARRLVMMKEHRDSSEFERLGFNQVFRSYSKIAYGVMER